MGRARQAFERARTSLKRWFLASPITRVALTCDVRGSGGSGISAVGQVSLGGLTISPMRPNRYGG